MVLNLGVHLRSLLFLCSSRSRFQDRTHCFIACVQAPSIAPFFSETLWLLKGWGSKYWYLMPYSRLDNLLNVKCKPVCLLLAALLVRLEWLYLPPRPHCCDVFTTPHQVFPKIPSLLVLHDTKMVFSRGWSWKPEVILISSHTPSNLIHWWIQTSSHWALLPSPMFFFPTWSSCVWLLQ